MSAALEEKRQRQLSVQRKLRRTEAEHQRQMSAALVRTEAGLNEAERKRVQKKEYNKKYRTLMKQQERESENEPNSVIEPPSLWEPQYYIVPIWKDKRKYNRAYRQKKDYIRRHGLITGTNLYEKGVIIGQMEGYIRDQISIKEDYDSCQISKRKWYHEKEMMKLSEIDKNRVAGIWKRYLVTPSSIRKWLVEYDKRVLDYSATPPSSNELQQIIVESDMEHYISERIQNKNKYNCILDVSEWRERYDKAMMGLSEIDKNRIAGIWERYLDPPSSIRKWLEEYDKKVQCVFSYTSHLYLCPLSYSSKSCTPAQIPHGFCLAMY